MLPIQAFRYCNIAGCTHVSTACLGRLQKDSDAKNRKIRKKYQQVALEEGIPDMVITSCETKYSMRKMQNTFLDLTVLAKDKSSIRDKLYTTRKLPMRRFQIWLYQVLILGTANVIKEMI